ncbi:MAG: sulfatase-like hydrolase/transferase [Elusimicrobiota bacterium]|jgi:phosphoglycerol transferase MdoB-like AlkP superfamily enzyme|nr:sulfatase-like hydrolase/transferase [Elusimicrobiota bacterium]
MLSFIKKYLLLLKQDFWLFAVLSIPGLIFYFIGIYNLEAANWFTISVGTINKFAFEFFTVSIIFCFLHTIGFKKKQAFATAFFLYYITITADVVLLLYFKERFGIKYLPTLAGGQYKFLFDIRTILLILSLYFFPYLTIKKLWLHRQSRHISAKKIALCAVLILLLAIINPIAMRKDTSSFYAARLMNTTVAEILKDLTLKKYEYKEYDVLPADLNAAALDYDLFNPTDFKNKNVYERIILITTEAFSDKFIKSFNPAIPAQASDVFDNLVKNYPFASLKPSALSTLYGLSVIFSGHPNAEMIYKNDFPLSFVKILRSNGFRTAFIRGAAEDYMDEHIIFKSAGFDEIYGAKYFERIAQYSNYVAWWGLTDRKLFEYSADYLQKHKNEKVFINIMTVDTHVPSGRDDYLGQQYPPLQGGDLDEKTAKIYSGVNMARAFSYYNYDLGIFLQNLADRGLLDDKTIVIVTGDHPFFANVDTGNLFKNHRPVFDEVPLIFVSSKEIEETISYNIFKSQQDIAPTILGLAGLPTPRGMFGRSVFEETPRTVFYMKNGYVIIKNAKGAKVISFDSRKPEDKILLQLLNSVIK